MPSRFWLVLVVLLLLIALAACSDPAAPAPATQLPARLPGPVLPAATLTPTSDPFGWQPIELPEVGLRLVAPPDWQVLEDGGFWSPASGARLMVTVLTLPDGAQNWDAFLPTDYDLLADETFASGLGLGDCWKIAVLRRPSQSAPRRFELHILVNSGDHPAVDFSASDVSEDNLDLLRPQLEYLAASARWME